MKRVCDKCDNAIVESGVSYIKYGEEAMMCETCIEDAGFDEVLRFIGEDCVWTLLSKLDAEVYCVDEDEMEN